MKEWDIFTSEPSVDNYLVVTALEDSPKTKEYGLVLLSSVQVGQRTFKQKVLEQLGLAEFCRLGHRKTVKGGYYSEKMFCRECNL